MFKTNIVNLVLFIFVIVLASVIYFSEQADTLLNRLTETDANDISTIKIQHNKNTTVIKKQQAAAEGSQWLITAPTTVAANAFRINSILKLINAPVHSQYKLEQVNLSDIGLDKPQTSILLNNHHFEFGITNPATNLRYIKFNNRIHTIEDVYFPLLSSHFSTLVSFNLLPANSKMNKLILLNQTMRKDEQGLWQSNKKTGGDDINKAIDHWQHEQAFGVHQYMPREQPIGEVFIYIEGQKNALNFVITDTDPWLIMARPDIGLEYHLDSEAYNKLLAPQ